MPSNPLITGALRASAPRQQAAPQSDRSSLLRTIAGNVMSPLAKAANVLDIPGSMARDVLTGSNPFDQILTPFQDVNRQSGRDVLTHYGLTAPNDPQRWELADVGGFLAEVGLDPLTYATGFTSGIGKALRGSGKASHLFKATVPFTRMEAPVGKGVAQLLDKAAGKAWQTSVPLTGKSVGQFADAAKTGVAGLFDSAAKGAFEPVQQAFNRGITRAEDIAYPRGAKLSQTAGIAMTPIRDQFIKELGSHAKSMGLDESKAFDEVLRHADEIAGPRGKYDRAFRRSVKRVLKTEPSKELMQGMSGALRFWADTRKMLNQASTERGVKTGWVESTKMAHTPRQGNQALLEMKGKTPTSGGLMSDPSFMQRNPILRTVPQRYLDEMLAKRSVVESNKGAEKIAKKYGKYLGFTREDMAYKFSDRNLAKPQIEKLLKDPQKYADPKNIVSDFGANLGYKKADKAGALIQVTPDQHAEELAKKLGKVFVSPLDHAKMLRKKIMKTDASITSFHENNPIPLQDRYIRSQVRIAKVADEVHDFLGQNAVASGGVPLAQAYKTLGMRPKAAVNWYAKLKGISAEDAAKVMIDPETLTKVADLQNAMKVPAWLDFLGKGVDKFNKAFKSNVTLPFPGFHIRNWLSGQHMNITSGHVRNPKEIGEYIDAYKEAMRLRSQGDTNKMIREAIAHKVLDPKKTLDDVDLPSNQSVSTTLAQSPAKSLQDARAYVDDPENANPLMDAIPGGKQTRVGYNTMINAGGNVAQTAEYYNRMTMFIYLKKKGMSSADAAKEVEKLQFNYEKATPFERNVAKRIIPFWGFQRNITPQIAAMLADRPGGGMAQSIRAGAAGRGEDEVLPANIAGTAAVPLGEQPDGSKRYLTGFGLSAEAAAPFLTSPADMGGAALEMMASTTPLLKYPAELATGQSFFQRGMEGGRQLKDMDPNIGRLISNFTGNEDPTNWLGSATRPAEHLVGNTPLSRYISTARGLTDKRKWDGPVPTALTNFLTPIKKTDVSPQQQERMLQQASNVLADQMGAGTWSNRYFSEKTLAKLDRDNPLLAAQARQLKELWSEAKRNAKKVKGKGKGEMKKARSSTGPERALLRAAGM